MKKNDYNNLEHPPVKIPIGQLSLDPDNPRLASVTLNNKLKEDDLAAILWREMDVKEVALSIAANGFFEEEVLFVVPENPKIKSGPKAKFIVVEGNRRFTAVKVLLNKKLRTDLNIFDLPELSEKIRKSLLELPVSIYNNKEELWEYFGLRHINGAKPWDAFSKAKYVADVFEVYGIPIDKIAQKIGDENSLIRKLYRGYTILRQAEANGFNKEDRIKNRFYFSHLYTATDQIEFQKFLAIDPDKSLKKNPVGAKKLKELNELMTWLYGNKSTNTPPLIKSQNPDLRKLREAIGKSTSLAALRAKIPLERAYEISLGDTKRFRENITRAKDELQQAKATVTTGYQGETDLMDIVKDIVTYANSIYDEVEEKNKSKKKIK